MYNKEKYAQDIENKEDLKDSKLIYISQVFKKIQEKTKDPFAGIKEIVSSIKDYNNNVAWQKEIEISLNTAKDCEYETVLENFWKKTYIILKHNDSGFYLASISCDQKSIEQNDESISQYLNKIKATDKGKFMEGNYKDFLEFLQISENNIKAVFIKKQQESKGKENGKAQYAAFQKNLKIAHEIDAMQSSLRAQCKLLDQKITTVKDAKNKQTVMLDTLRNMLQEIENVEPQKAHENEKIIQIIQLIGELNKNTIFVNKAAVEENKAPFFVLAFKEKAPFLACSKNNLQEINKYLDCFASEKFIAADYNVIAQELGLDPIQ